MATGIYIFMAASSTASVAALVSIYGVMMSKEQSISEFRQTWINELRDEIAEFLSITTHLANINTIIHPSQDILTSHYKILLNLNNISFKLQLRLNPDEYQPEINLIEEINNIVKSQLLSKDDNELNVMNEKLHELTKTFVDKSTIILKKEWERVKQGEGSIIRYLMKLKYYIKYKNMTIDSSRP